MKREREGERERREGKEREMRGNKELLFALHTSPMFLALPIYAGPIMKALRVIVTTGGVGGRRR